jgi:FkbM family methyltransferase
MSNIEQDLVFNVTYDNSSNKISYISNQDVNEAVIAIKDIDSKAVLYSVQHKIFQKNCEHWIIPLPKSFLDFETDLSFGGILVEIYSRDYLLYQKSFRIKNISIEKPVLRTKNNTCQSYFNYNEFFVKKIYDRFLSSKKFNTVVDVGANTGIWIEYINYYFNPSKIYAVEPNIQALKVLRDTYQNNEVVIIDRALSNKDGELELFVNPDNSVVSSTSKFDHLTQSCKVSSISFKTMIQQYNIDKIDLLKVDIETGEYDLFESFDKKDLDIIENVLVEYHIGKEFADKDMKDVKAILSLLRGNGFKCNIVTENEGGNFIFGSKQN